MDNVSEVVALLRQQAVLENQILTTGGDPRSRRNGRSPPPVAGSWPIQKRSPRFSILRARYAVPPTPSPSGM